MEDNHDIDNVGSNLLKKMQDKNIDNQVQIVQDIDEFRDLRMQLFSFFKQRMGAISAKEKILQRLNERILDYVDANDNMPLEEMQSIYRMYAADSREATDSFLALFKPTPGTPSLLAQNISEKEEKKDKFDELYESMSADDLQKLDKFVKAFKAIEINPEENTNA